MHTSYHVHSTWSDGRSTLDELRTAAAGAGLAEWGVSDHIVNHPNGMAVRWSMATARLPEYVAAVSAMRDEAPAELPLRMGLELDYFPGEERRIAELTRGIPFDYILGAVHYIDGFNIDGQPEVWERMTPKDVNDAWRGYYARVEGLANSGLYTCVAHLDLPKSFGHRPTEDVTAERDRALDAVARAGMAVEVNTSGLRKACAEVYPSPDILRACRARGIPAQVNADAHAAADIGRWLDEGTAALRAAGYTEVVRFQGMRMLRFPLPSA
jgi:histidinol-phosphatase (PHP family)